MYLAKPEHLINHNILKGQRRVTYGYRDWQNQIILPAVGSNRNACVRTDA